MTSVFFVVSVERFDAILDKTPIAVSLIAGELRGHGLDFSAAIRGVRKLVKISFRLEAGTCLKSPRERGVPHPRAGPSFPCQDGELMRGVRLGLLNVAGVRLRRSDVCNRQYLISMNSRVKGTRRATATLIKVQ